MNHAAIFATHPDIKTIRGDKTFDANDNPINYDKVIVQTYIDDNAYKVQRAAAYPSIQQQLDTLYHGGYDVWKASITAVKDEFPK